jgi:hypothetical protein
MVKSNKYVSLLFCIFIVVLKVSICPFSQVCELSLMFSYFDLTCWVFLQLLEFDESVATGCDDAAHSSSEGTEVNMKSKTKKSD